jgi:hypothetical protein
MVTWGEQEASGSVKQILFANKMTDDVKHEVKNHFLFMQRRISYRGD